MVVGPLQHHLTASGGLGVEEIDRPSRGVVDGRVKKTVGSLH